MALIYIPETAAKHGIKPVKMHEIINPRIEAVDEELLTDTERCHSVR